MIPRNHKRECTSQLDCLPENAPMADGPDSKIAMMMNKVGPNSTKPLLSNERRRRVLCSVGILAMAGPYSTLLGVLVLNPSCVGMVSAFRAEGPQEAITQGNTSEGGMDRGTRGVLAPGRVQGNLKHIKSATLKLESTRANESGEEEATLLDGLLVASTKSSPPPHGAVTTPAVLDATEDGSLQHPLPPTRNSGVSAGFDEGVLVAGKDGDKNAGDEDNGARAEQRIPDVPPVDKPEEVEEFDELDELERGKGIVSDKLRVSAAGVDNQSKNLRVRGGERYELGSRVLMSQGENEGSQGNGQEDETGSEETLMIIWIVVGCGIVTLVVLCIVRKIMDLCMFRNDPTGSIRYSQEEGLTKTVIERLPQTKYKSLPTKGGKQVKKSQQQQQQQQAHKMQITDEGAIEQTPGVAYLGEKADVDPTSGTGGSGGALPDAVSTAMKQGEERDSTEDMCAICLVDYEVGDALRILPGCRHHFHKECIDPWLETKAVCAYCKATVEPNKTLCDRMLGWVSDRVGFHPVAPTTFHFSSTRRTFTNREVQLMMEPSLPPAYQRSELDYVGSMVAARPPSGDHSGGAAGDPEASGGPGLGPIGPPSGLRGAAFGSTAGGVIRADSASAVVISDERQEPQGAIVAQPSSAPRYTVVPRAFASSSGTSTVSGTSGASAASGTPAVAAGSGPAGERAVEVAPGTGNMSGVAVGGAVSRRGSRSADEGGGESGSQVARVVEEAGVSPAAGLMEGKEEQENKIQEEKALENAEEQGATQSTSRQGVGMHGVPVRVGGNLAAAGLDGAVLQGSLGPRESMRIDGELKVPEAESVPEGSTGQERLEGRGQGEEHFQDVPL